MRPVTCWSSTLGERELGLQDGEVVAIAGGGPGAETDAAGALAICAASGRTAKKHGLKDGEKFIMWLPCLVTPAPAPGALGANIRPDCPFASNDENFDREPRNEKKSQAPACAVWITALDFSGRSQLDPEPPTALLDGRRHFGGRHQRLRDLV
jgi:hypothetical protein